MWDETLSLFCLKSLLSSSPGMCPGLKKVKRRSRRGNCRKDRSLPKREMLVKKGKRRKAYGYSSGTSGCFTRECRKGTFPRSAPLVIASPIGSARSPVPLSSALGYLSLDCLHRDRGSAVAHSHRGWSPCAFWGYLVGSESGDVYCSP